MFKNPEDWNLEAVVQLWTAERQPHPVVLQAAIEVSYVPFADPSGEHLGANRVSQDRERLKQALSKVRRVADKTIAHSERHSGSPPNITFAELDEAIEACHELVKPYISLLTGRGYHDMTPVEQYNWWKIFAPWSELRPFGG
jgi:hypothetical protein